ncbi:hypothetical protein ACP4OV_028048 [Aristida adscensionis]
MYYIVEDKTGAITLMLLSLFLLSTLPFQCRGRLPQHTYLDYSITNLFVAVAITLICSQLGDQTRPSMRSFFTQLSQVKWPSVLLAMAGGAVLSVGNLCTQYAWAYVNLSVTEAASAGMVVVLVYGTTLAFFRISQADMVFPGMVCFLVAVVFGSAVHASCAGSAADNEDKTDVSNDAVEKDSANDEENASSATKDPTIAEAGAAEYPIEPEERRSVKVSVLSTFRWLGIGFFSGACFSLFCPAINLDTNDQWMVSTTFIIFSISRSVIGIGFNFFFLYRPMAAVPKSSLRAYLNDWKGRHWAVVVGLLCGFAGGFKFIGGQDAAVYAVAKTVQEFSLVKTLWGILLLGKYRKSSWKTYILLGFTLFMFIAAVALLMASSYPDHAMSFGRSGSCVCKSEPPEVGKQTYQCSKGPASGSTERSCYSTK